MNDGEFGALPGGVVTRELVEIQIEFRCERLYQFLIVVFIKARKGLQVARAGPVLKQRRVIAYITDGLFPVRGIRGHSFAIELDNALVLPDCTHQASVKSRFTGPIGTNQAMHRTGLQLEIDRAERKVAVALAEVDD